jgi:hypothetical protein
MAGGFPSKMKAKKNKFVEEWNGMRENTEHHFEVTQQNVPQIILALIVFPACVYWGTRTEMKNRGERRVENLV